MAAIQFTKADRDENGFIKAPAEPRSLAELLPHPIAPADQAIHRQPPTRFELVSAAIVAPLLIAALLYVSSGRTVVPAARPIATAAPATSVPTAAPLPTVAPVRMLPAFDRPEGAQLGRIEATRTITPLAHYGADWIQADVSGSGRIWLRAADFPQLAIVGSDLAPRPTIAPVYVAATEPPPAPPPCAEAGVAGRMVTVCDYDDLAALQERAKAEWLRTYGGNVGMISHPTPQLVR